MHQEANTQVALLFQLAVEHTGLHRRSCAIEVEMSSTSRNGVDNLGTAPVKLLESNRRLCRYSNCSMPSRLPVRWLEPRSRDCIPPGTVQHRIFFGDKKLKKIAMSFLSPKKMKNW